MMKHSAETQAEETMDEPFENAQHAAEERIENAGDAATGAAYGAIEGGAQSVEAAARNATKQVRFSSGDASDEFDSDWAEKPTAAE